MASPSPLPGPLVLVMARSILALLVQALVAGVFYLGGSSAPWQAAAPWWSVYGTLIDLGCLTLLVHFTRKEGIGVGDLIRFRPERRGRELFQGLGLFLLIFPLLFVGGAMLGSWIIYGSPAPPLYAGQLGGRVLPLWGIVYSVCVWWIGWSVTEETVYQAYCLIRFEKLFGRTWPAVLVVTFFFTLQHSFFPLILDIRYVLWRFLAFLPGCLALTLIYARTRRLPPLIAAHWPMDIVAVAMTLHW